MAADLCLSDLPDDLLRRVLSFAPAKEGASTAVLSRRWRSLWRTSGAVNIDSRSYGVITFRTAGHFVLGVKAALDSSSSSPIRRLSVRVEIEAKTYAEVERKHGDLIDVVLSHPTARQRGVEAVHIGGYRPDWKPSDQYIHGLCTLSCGALPSASLRVLHVTNCGRLMPAPPGAAFPSLAELRLQGCWISAKRLQPMLDTSPQLATLHLEHTSLCYYSDDHEEAWMPVTRCYRLRCPSVTALVLKYPSSWVEGGIELDVPRLRSLSFKGSARSEKVSLKSSHALEVVDLHLTDAVDPFEEENKVRVPFWRFFGNLTNAKVMKLKLDYPINHIAVAEEDQLLSCSVNLSRLELDGSYKPSSKAAAAVAIANLLRSCPVLRDLRLKLREALLTPSKTASHFRLIAPEIARRNFDESVAHFKRCRISSSPLGHHDDDDIDDVPGLSDRSFACMKDCLRRVTLQFHRQTKTPNCFGTQLLKFFTQNGAVLEEAYIDDGIHRICEHIDLAKIARWSANSPKRRNPLTATRVLPHET
jgi:hypothetical protein